MNVPVEELVPLVVANSNLILTNRYLTAASAIALLYDHAMTLPEEIRLIWTRRAGVLQGLFLFARYFTLANLLFVAWITSGAGSYSNKTREPSCQVWLVEGALSFFVSIAISHSILIIRLYALYDQRKNILRTLQIAFAITYVIALVFGAISVQQVDDNILWIPIAPMSSCIITMFPKYMAGYWVPQVLFELFAFVMTITNAAERPRPANSKLISQLTRDGFVYFFMLFGIRAVNMIMSALPTPKYDLLMLYFTWSITMITLSRMILRVESMRAEAAASARLFNDDDALLYPEIVAIHTVTARVLL